MHDDYPLIQGRVHTGDFVFVRNDSLTDIDIFAALGFEITRAIDLTRENVRAASIYAITARTLRWTHWYDNLLYTLYNQPDRDTRLQRLAQIADLFTFTIGDPDESYEFRFYAGGTLVRWRKVDSPQYWDRVVVQDLGTPLPGENKRLFARQGDEILTGIAEALGIELQVRRDALRGYEYTVSTEGSQI